MMKIALSRPASGLLRALLRRAGEERDRILLSDFRSVDWQSLTFAGERHRLKLRIVGADREQLLERLVTGLEDAEFSIPGHLVADISVAGEPVRDRDGVTIAIEALTVAD